MQMTYIITIIACVFIWMNYGAMVKLRWRYFSTPEFQNALHNRSLMITQVPKDFRSDEGPSVLPFSTKPPPSDRILSENPTDTFGLMNVRDHAGLQALFNSLQAPYPTTSVHIGRRVGQLPALIEMHNQAVRELEQILTTYLKNPNKLPAKRPTIRVGGFLGCCGGQVVDAIDYYEAKVKRIEGAIEIARNEITSKKAENYGEPTLSFFSQHHVGFWFREVWLCGRKPPPRPPSSDVFGLGRPFTFGAGFASMGKVTSAHIVAKKVEGKKTKKATIELAPHPTGK